MIMENEILVYDFVGAISEAVDLVSPVLNNHHKRVAYLSFSIAQEIGLPNDEIQDIILASMLHDIGSFSVDERIKYLSFAPNDLDMNKHAIMGYALLKDFDPLAKAARLIRDHHEDFDRFNNDIAMGSHIINLADRASHLFDEQSEFLGQVPGILLVISEKKNIFHPEVLAAFYRLARKEYFWIEAFLPSFGAVILDKMHFPKEIVDLETLRDFARVVAQIIDFRSRFTATHSSGVAAVAKELSMFSGFSDRECKMMEIAGFLHDLGKLAVPNEILEKNGVLNDQEFNFVRKHTYYTYFILNGISGFEHIASWASHHHERPDGNGYPFHIEDRDFSKLERIMAVADMVTALSEDRPYRAGMDRAQSERTLRSKVESGGIDRDLVELAYDNFSHINDVRINTQHNARKEYDAFHYSIYENSPVIQLAL